MRYLELKHVLWLHRRLIESSSGALGIRDMATLQSAIAQPMMSVGGVDAYPGLIDKAAALCFSLVCNHPFVDGNKRIGHAAAEVFLLLHGHEIAADVDEQEQLFLRLAAGEVSRTELVRWLEAHVVMSGTET